MIIFTETEVFFHAFPDYGTDQTAHNAVRWLNGELLKLGTTVINPLRPSATVETSTEVVNGVSCQYIAEPWVQFQVGKFIGPNPKEYDTLYTAATTDAQRKEIIEAYQQLLYVHEEVHQAITLKRRTYDRFNEGRWLPIRLRLLKMEEGCLTNFV